MQNYNVQYLELKQRLKTIYLILDADSSLDDTSRQHFQNKINECLIALDDRYSDGKPLSVIESSLKNMSIK